MEPAHARDLPIPLTHTEMLWLSVSHERARIPLPIYAVEAAQKKKIVRRIRECRKKPAQNQENCCISNLLFESRAAGPPSAASHDWL